MLVLDFEFKKYAKIVVKNHKGKKTSREKVVGLGRGFVLWE